MASSVLIYQPKINENLPQKTGANGAYQTTIYELINLFIFGVLLVKIRIQWERKVKHKQKTKKI